ncbi:MAG: cytochrome C [Armatimonadetes bacterium]|nr:cytochrome C [Armatimonadota bacterium]
MTAVIPLRSRRPYAPNGLRAKGLKVRNSFAAIVGLLGTVLLFAAGSGVVSTPVKAEAKAATASNHRSAGQDSACVKCHEKTTPKIVTDWRISKHSGVPVDCSDCHGSEHKTVADAANAKIPTPQTCAKCHGEQVEQFMEGKHSKAWTVMKAMPTTHYQPMMLTEGLKGCGGCHKIGVKSEADIKEMSKSGSTIFGLSSCDSCHTRHTFSVKEAKQPQACQTCHMGFDHPQWEMYSASKHGVRNGLKQNGQLPEDTAAPTCQTCHMDEGHHGVKTAWGFLAVRLPLPEDKEWAADQVTILQGLGVLDPTGKPTARLDAVKAVDAARLTQEEWQVQRDKMIRICSKCHSQNFAKGELEKGDRMIREADKLMAEGVRIVAGLYNDGIIPKPENYAAAFPDLLAFHDSPTPIEQKLWTMFLEHRMRTFQGTYHANPDYALWYGWSAMKTDIVEIRGLEKDMREKSKKG